MPFSFIELKKNNCIPRQLMYFQWKYVEEIKKKKTNTGKHIIVQIIGPNFLCP